MFVVGSRSRPPGELCLAEAGATGGYFVSGDVIQPLLTGAQTGYESTLARITVLPGAGQEIHRHMQHETLFVLDGEIEFTGARHGSFRNYAAGPGTLFHAPGCVPHRYFNRGDKLAQLLSFTSPAGLESFYRKAGRLVTDSAQAEDLTADSEQVFALGLEHGIEPIDPELYDTREGYRATGAHFCDCTKPPSYIVLSEFVRFLACSDQTDAGLTVLEITQLSGGAVPLHSHVPSAVYFVLDGAFEFTAHVQDSPRRLEANAGNAVHVPRAMTHSFRNTAEHNSRLLMFINPAGLEDFVIAAGRESSVDEFLQFAPEAPTAAELERIVAIGTKSGVQIIAGDS